MPSAFAVPAFRRLWAAGFISDSGDWLLFIALPLVVLRLTGSALGLSLSFLLELLPAVALAPLTARLVDRFDRRALMCVVNVAQAISLLPLLFVRTAADLPLLYLVIVLQAAFSTAFEPAKNALLPQLVDEKRIVSANALIGLNQNLARLAGGALGGLLLSTGGLGVVIVADLVSYLASAALVVTLPRVSVTPAASGEARAAGILSVLRRADLRGWFAVMFTAGIAQGLFIVLFVLFVTQRLAGSDADVGLLRGIQAVGAIAAGLCLGFFSSKTSARRLTVVGIAAFGVISLVTWNLPFLSTNLWLYIVLFALVGAPGVLMMTGVISGLQLASDDRQRGSVFTALGLVGAVGQAVGTIAAGLLTSEFGVLPLLEVQGCVYLAAAVIAALWLPRPVAVRAAT